MPITHYQIIGSVNAYPVSVADFHQRIADGRLIYLEVSNRWQALAAQDFRWEDGRVFILNYLDTFEVRAVDWSEPMPALRVYAHDRYYYIPSHEVQYHVRINEDIELTPSTWSSMGMYEGRALFATTLNEEEGRPDRSRCDFSAGDTFVAWPWGESVPESPIEDDNPGPGPVASALIAAISDKSADLESRWLQSPSGFEVSFRVLTSPEGLPEMKMEITPQEPSLKEPLESWHTRLDSPLV